MAILCTLIDVTLLWRVGCVGVWACGCVGVRVPDGSRQVSDGFRAAARQQPDSSQTAARQQPERTCANTARMPRAQVRVSHQR